MKRIINILLCLIIAATMLTGCSDAEHTKQLIQAATENAEECVDTVHSDSDELPETAPADENIAETAFSDNKNTPTDYSDPDNWYKNEYDSPDKAHTDLDVIFFHGTATTADVIEDGFAQICDGMKEYVDSINDCTAAVFDDGVRMFLPYYRQLSFETQLACKTSQEALNMAENTVEETDICAVLDYYFDNYNEGRPFILAGYSQGGMAVQIALDKYFGCDAHRKYLDNMVAAYSIAFGVDKNWLAERDYLKFATGADDTGVVISWNTEGPGEKGTNPLLAPNPSDTLVINPINWKTDNTYASAEECLGSYVDGKIITPGVYNLQIDPERGSVICDNNTDYVDDGTGNLWGGKSLHAHEIDEAYLSIRQNMHDRFDAFIEINIVG